MIEYELNSPVLEAARYFLFSLSSVPTIKGHAYGNIYITNIADVTRATDARYTAVTENGTDANGNTTYSYPEIVMGDDGYYHIGSKTGSLLLAELTEATLWSQIHVGSNTIQVADGLVPASLYYISYWDNRMNVNLNIEGQPTKFV